LHFRAAGVLIYNILSAADMGTNKQVICVSWNASLAQSRELLLRSLGLNVLSALYEKQARLLCREKADLLILGHSVPQVEKRALIDCFREHSDAPVLSLLGPGETKLPTATYGVEAAEPEKVLHTVKEILAI